MGLYVPSTNITFDIYLMNLFFVYILCVGGEIQILNVIIGNDIMCLLIGEINFMTCGDLINYC